VGHDGFGSSPPVMQNCSRWLATWTESQEQAHPDEELLGPFAHKIAR
jgi:hypothetical protein